MAGERAKAGRNDDVRAYWELEACGTGAAIVGELPEGTTEWFERVEAHRYELEPFIHSIAMFTQHRGHKVLEVGVGAGTDHLQWARAGAECFGVDLTERAVALTAQRLALYGFQSSLRRIDAEILPFQDDYFDVVYSWGVIHHSSHPAAIVNEIRRVLKPGGKFLGMLYNRHSLVAYKLWVRHALLAGRPWRGLAEVVWHHMESQGTKAYTLAELHALFSGFRQRVLTPIVTPYDARRLPGWIAGWIPPRLGWFVGLQALK